MTATRFVPDPHAATPGERLYRSGDRARLGWDGDLSYLGRLDEQVKIRGFRIELAEIAAALRAHSDLDQVIVVVQARAADPVEMASNNAFAEQDRETDGSPRSTSLRNLLKKRASGAGEAEKFLTAYFTKKDGAALPSGPALRAFLRDHLPEHMIPSYFVGIPSMPLTNHGKLDTAALPRVDRAREKLDLPYVLPRNAQEKKLADLWAEVLGLDHVGIDDPFFDLGGDSITSIRLRARAREEGFDFTLQELMREKTIRALLAQKTFTASAADETATIEPFALLRAEDRAALPEDIEDAYPPARLQEGLLFHSSLDADIPMYCDIFIYHLAAPFREAKMVEALGYLVRRHPILRTGFDFQKFSEPLQLVHCHAEIPLEIHRLEDQTPEQQQALLRAWLEEEKRRRYDWVAPPLLRFTAFLIDQNAFYLGMSFHDALMDGWSESSILTQLLTDYFALCKDQPLPTYGTGLGFRDFIALERKVLRDEGQWSFWREELAELELAHLPVRRGARHAEPEMTFLDVPITASTTEELKALASRAGTSLKHVLLAAHCRMLALLTGRSDVLTALESNGRVETMGGEEVLGCHLNAVPFRLNLASGSWLELIQRVCDKEAHLTPYRRYPYAEIQRRMGGEPLFDTSFNYTHFHVYRQLSALEGLEIKGAHAYIQTHFTLRVEFNQDPFSGQITLDLEADRNKLDEAQQKDIGAMFLRVLGTMATHATEPLGAACLLPEHQRRLLLRDWNDTRRATSPVLPHIAIAEQAKKRGNQVAVGDRDGQIDYGVLEAVTDRIAIGLRARGIGCESLVAIVADRGIDYLSMVLGIFKSGGAYMPLAGHPVDRALRVMNRAHAQLIVCHRSDEQAVRRILEEMTAPPPLVLIETLTATATEGATLPIWQHGTARLANIFFTSGSTGEPKGAMIHYAGMANHMAAKIEMLDLCADDLVSQDAAQTFDISLWQMLAALMVGGRVQIFDDEISKDPLRLFHAVQEREITILEVSPAVLGVFVDEAERLGTARPNLSALRLVPCSGEALPPATCRRWLDLYPAIAVINMWGATECSDDVSSVAIAEPPPLDQTIMPLGYPIGDIQILVLDRFGQLAPRGTEGQLYIGGTGVGLGYRNEPGRTAWRFSPNPFAGSVPGMPSGSRLYRTGDLGRMRADGQAEFLGRTDHQVKIRGFRVELGDIEAALAALPEISQALVVTATDPRGDRVLAAYLCPSDPAEVGRLDIAAIREQLAARLPAYMIPTAFTVLERFPLNTNGKIDRKALPDPEPGQEQSGPIEAPRSATERILAELWCDLLELESVGRNQDFFEVGGHSLLATRLAARVRERFAVDLPIRAFFEHRTIAALAERLTGPIAEPAHSEAIEAVPNRPDGRYELSFAQSRIWVLEQIEGEHGAYNMASQMRIRGPLSLVALERSMTAIIARHETLRTSFGTDGTKLFQQVAPAADLDNRVIDLGGLPDASRETEVARLIRAAARCRFALATGPLLNIAILRLKDQDHLMLITMHHIISDGWSGGVMIRELAAHYAAALQCLPADLAPLPVQYRDFAHWQRRTFAGQPKKDLIAFWQQRLAGAPPLLELPTDLSRPPIQSFRGAELRFPIAGPLLAELRRLGEAQGMSLFMLLHGALAILLHQYSGERDLVIGAPIANRDRLEIEPLIGFFVNTLALRSELNPASSLRANLHALREADLDAFAHQHMPFDQLVEVLQPERNASHHPLFQVLLVLQNAPAEPIALPGLQLEYGLTGTETSKFDMLLSVEEGDGALQVTWEYATDLFRETTIRGMAERWVTLLGLLSANLDRPLAALSSVSAADRETLIHAWNDRHQSLPHVLLHHFFEAQVARTPQRAALIWKGEEMSYATLNRRATALASLLLERGVGRDQLVGIALTRNPLFAIGTLGILKAGAAYVPLDPDYPEQRLAHMIADAQMDLILTETALVPMLPADVALMALDTLPDESAQSALPERAFVPEQLAYGIFTSGSTGKPKCVLMSHGALANVLTFMMADLGVDDSCTLALASWSFDVHLMELMGSWSLGHRVHIISEELRRDPEQLAVYAWENGIHRAILPVVILHAWGERFARNRDHFIHLRHLIATGEQLTINEEVRRLFAARPDIRLSNYYGPSETHVITALDLPGDPRDWPYHAPIGATLANTRTYLLGETLEPVPIGAKGFLYSAGANLFRGYHRRPALTAEKLVPDPFSAQPGARMYATGDQARYAADSDGQIPPLVFLGRKDHMVKIRGFRIELGEIAAKLSQWPEVRFVHVTGIRQGAVTRLVAYLRVPQPYPTRDRLMTFMQTELPAYMVPDIYVFLEELPLSPNGKVDTRRLPQPDLSHMDGTGQTRPPETPVERWLVKQFQSLVDVQDIAIDHNFFELGGHSISATQLAHRVEEGLDLSLPPREVFRHATVRALVDYLATQAGGREVLEQIAGVAEHIDAMSEEEVQQTLATLNHSFS